MPIVLCGPLLVYEALGLLMLIRPPKRHVNLINEIIDEHDYDLQINLQHLQVS